MKIIDQLNWRYATKKFDANYTLPKPQLEILKQAFNLTALSYGLQTLKLIIIKNKDKRETLVEHAFNQRQVADASHLFIICVQNTIDKNDVNQHFNNIIDIRNTPEDILEPFKNQLQGTLDNMTTEAKLSWAKNQAYIALGNLMTVCAVEKIDSCPMEGFNSKMFDSLLKLNEKNLVSVLLLPVGKRAEDDMFADFKKVRKSLEDTIIEL